MEEDKRFIVAPVFTALIASVCCISPVIAVLGGITGLAATFSWLEPYRPYMLVLTALCLGYAWLRYFQSRKKACDCENDSFDGYASGSSKRLKLNSPKFLSLISALTVLLASFPYYGSYLIAEDKPNVLVVESKNIETKSILVGGMTCESCEKVVESSLLKLNGVISAQASTSKGNVVVEYDATKVKPGDLFSSIEKTGYQVLTQKN